MSWELRSTILVAFKKSWQHQLTRLLRFVIVFESFCYFDYISLYVIEIWLCLNTYQLVDEIISYDYLLKIIHYGIGMIRNRVVSC